MGKSNQFTCGFGFNLKSNTMIMYTIQRKVVTVNFIGSISRSKSIKAKLCLIHPVYYFDTNIAD